MKVWLCHVIEKGDRYNRLVCFFRGHIDSTKHLQPDLVDAFGEFYSFPSSSYCLRCHMILWCGKPTNFIYNGKHIKYIEEWNRN